MRRTAKLMLVCLLVATAACEDLDVTNPNNPSLVTVQANSQDLLSLINNGLLQWFDRSNGTRPGIAMSCMADEFSTGFLDFGGQYLSTEPRDAIDNGIPTGNAPPHHETWPDYYANIAALNTALKLQKDGDLVLRDAAGDDMTTPALAYAKFVQGLNHGYIALMFDKGYVHSESLDLEALADATLEELLDLIRPYGEVLDTALAELNASLQIANSASFTYPASVPTTWFLGYSRTSQELARIVHTYIARLMVYVARSPAERAAVDWNAVIAHIDQGITEDFEVMGVTGFVDSYFKQRAARQRTTRPSDFMRVDYRVVGPADQGPDFIEWYALPWADRNPFQMTDVQDRRIDGMDPAPATCAGVPDNASCGLYMGYHPENIFKVGRGTGQRSYYFYHRWGRGTSWESGPLKAVNIAEMDLIKAEGLIRLNRADEAIPLINKYRVTNGQLPPVDINGAPGTAPNCTPRRMDGTCGNLWDALCYEKRIETLGLEGGPAYYDARAWGFLAEYTAVEFPIPRLELELLYPGDQGAIYSFGGPGGESAAPPPNFEVCPAGVTLPGCP